MKESCDEICEKGTQIQNYPYLKSFLNDDVSQIISLSPIVFNNDFDDEFENTKLITEDAINSFLIDNNLKVLFLGLILIWVGKLEKLWKHCFDSLAKNRERKWDFDSKY